MENEQLEIRKALRRNGRVQLETGKGLTEQNHKEETDINQILEAYARTGFIKHAKNHDGQYDDVSVTDFQSAMFIVTQAQNMFNALPGQVRKRFANDPAQFLEFVQNPNNADEMRKMGILRGNDGLDMKGVPTQAPVIPEHIEQPMDKSTR